jgi:hypothetical protein
LFDLLAFGAYNFRVFATVHTAWKTAQETGEPQETKSPEDGDTSDFFSHDLSSVSSAELTVGSVISASIDLDDGRTGLNHWWGRHHWLTVHGLHGLSIHGLHGRLTVHWLSVHFNVFKLKFDNYYGL